jgi:hypothetical protein
MEKFGNTIVLDADDVREEYKETPTVDLTSYSFKLDKQEINRASNILYVDSANRVRFFKIKDLNQFRTVNNLF